MGNLSAAQHIYFSGIGGIGMSALAQLLASEGKKISGSDIARSEMIERLELQGISVGLTQDGSGIRAGIDLCIFTSAVPPTHPERQACERLGIPTLSYFEAVGEYAKEFENVIAISGTHGKSTTTALIGLILAEAGFNPTVIVGTVVSEFHSNARKGAKTYLVVEACEYKEHMMNIHPSMIVLTNIEADHLDYYRDLEHITQTFQKYIDGLPKNGTLFKNVDDQESVDLSTDARTVTYGSTRQCEYRATNIAVNGKTQTFSVAGENYSLHIPGKFNVYNATAAIAVSSTLDITQSTIDSVLKKFRGVWRRFEVVGDYHGATVISDYAHHPTAVHSTIKAARQFYPGKRVVVVFQPHQRDRTMKLFDGFTQSFSEADLVIIQEIYDVAGREGGEQISSRDLVKAVEKVGKYAFYTRDVAHTRQEIDELIEKDDVVLIMGAGDIYHLAQALCQ
ncbi:MAG: UDP-N-acetylmuramate--L-alanine ligase [Candidatus Kerfeldbacteria bacterium]|nr:UDP-N-acetylmuramate--L-alanine ligase [Candidatus Kerfeldbacteria bacterium]